MSGSGKAHSLASKPTSMRIDVHCQGGEAPCLPSLTSSRSYKDTTFTFLIWSPASTSSMNASPGPWET